MRHAKVSYLRSDLRFNQPIDLSLTTHFRYRPESGFLVIITSEPGARWFLALVLGIPLGANENNPESVDGLEWGFVVAINSLSASPTAKHIIQHLCVPYHAYAETCLPCRNSANAESS